MKSSVLVLLSSLVTSVVVSQPVKESGIDTEYGAYKYPRDLKPDPPPCRINQYFDREENKCMSTIGGGKALHINNFTSCEINTLKPHCTSPRYYYICTGNKVILAQCPDGRHYEDRLQKCVLVPQDKYISVTNRLSSNRLPTCESPGSFPAPDDCALFYTCTKNFFGMQRNFYRCPHKMTYDVQTGMCSPSSTCDESILPFLCPLNNTRRILNEAKHLVRRSRPEGQEKRTTIICKIVYLSEEEGTTKSIEDEVTDSLMTEFDNNSASTAERDRSTTTGGNAEESITEFQVTTSENALTNIGEISSSEPPLILTSLAADSTEEYYENTPGFTNVPESFDSISSESEITSRRSTLGEYITTQDVAETESSTAIISESTYNTIVQTTTELNKYVSEEFVSENQSIIDPNINSNVQNESTEEPLKDSSDFNNEDSIITFSTLKENEQTTTDQLELTDITEESLIPLNDLTTESNNEGTIILEDGIVTTKKYDPVFSSTDAANDFNTEVISTTERTGFSESTNDLVRDYPLTDFPKIDNAQTTSDATETKEFDPVFTSTDAANDFNTEIISTTEGIGFSESINDLLRDYPLTDLPKIDNEQTTPDSTETREYNPVFTSPNAANDFKAEIISTTEGIGFSEPTNDLLRDYPLTDLPKIDNEQTPPNSINTNTENSACFDLDSIPRGNTFETDSVTNSKGLSPYTSDVTENAVTESNSWNRDNSGTPEAAKTTNSQQQIRTVSKNIMLPIASAVLNVTDKLERYFRAILINYFSRYE